MTPEILAPPFEGRDPASSFSRKAFASRPPANPVSSPDEPITRWHGTTIEMGFRPLAAPTARMAVGLPICLAICS
jgi:outer membrane usher protein